jgi:hypothetical protein
MDEKLLDLFGDFLNKSVELHTESKVALGLINKDIGEIKETLGKSDRTVMSLLHGLERKGDSDQVKNFIETYTKRNYTNDEVKNLGHHVEQVDDMHRFSMKLKGRLAITAALIAAIIGIATLGEKIIALWDFLVNLGGV